ncbi:MAG TPA: hypothetical protein VGU61_08135 [Noviherbaspirillum sp.]|jgi:hypothetical protein|uniref:hypothetical protein n=1 Tax=Noviherbaspirillum sp. TaxID=1926288 RepID=UPI002DDD2C86|nr:hypothetical protein [Noviherbaspirillum sp.]HEV2610222.1 hypothetical protein [Noviherbaspirillum sp.]
MNGYFIAAAVLAFAIGLIHSMLGERLIFGRMRSTGFIPTSGGSALREPHVRILWASWHVVTVLGWCMAATLAWMAIPSSSQPILPFIGEAIIAAMLASSLLVFVGTRGKHPGWMGLLGVAVLAAMGLYA